jgi:hypothetical protein
MQGIRLLALTGVLAVAASSPVFADVHVTIANGRVSVVAREATLRQILTEWARVGQVRIVNVERIPGGPVSLELKDMPEDQALDLLLRSVAGYLAAPRADAVANASRFDRVVVMTSAAVPRTPVAAPAAAARPVFTPVQPPALEDENTAVVDQQPDEMPTPVPRGPVFNPFPQPQVVTPQVSVPSDVPGMAAEPQPADDDMPPQTPTVPGGVSAPGMIVPMPQAQPGRQPDRQ